MLTGTETHTLLEVFAVALGAIVSITHLVDLPVLAYLDATLAGVCTMVALGRIGCFSAGCCYGVVSELGIVYPHECGGDGTTRRFPVQLLDGAVWLLLAVTCGMTVGRAVPGVALATVLIAYGIARYSLEYLRGDRRPHWRGRSVSQWLSLLAIGAGSLIVQHLQDWNLGLSVLAGTSLLAFLALVALRPLWLSPEPSLDELTNQLDDLASRWAEEGSREIVVAQVGDYQLGSSCLRLGSVKSWSLSLSRLDDGCTEAEARLVLGALAERLGCAPGEVSVQRSDAGVYVYRGFDDRLMTPGINIAGVDPCRAQSTDDRALSRVGYSS